MTAGAAFPGEAVLREVPKGNAQTRQTAKDGSSSFQILGGGKYKLTISNPNFKTLTTRLTLDEPFTANLKLQAKDAME
jgi:hypothetical protein